MEDARELNETRLKVMEQIEKNNENLSRSHAKLQRKTQLMHDDKESLTESLNSLMEKCNEYKTEMEQLRHENAKLQKQLSTSRTQSETISRQAATKDVPVQCSSIENSVQDLSGVMKTMKFEQDIEKTLRKDLEDELLQLIIENQSLEDKLRSFSHGNRLSSAEQSKHIESSTVESLNTTTKADFEEDDTECSDESFVMVEEEGIVEMDSKSTEISFLDELDQQYRDLVTKYNALVEKCKNEGIPYESREMCTVQRAVQTCEDELVGTNVQETCVNVNEACSDGESLPKYKKIFAEIYAKIREGKECE